MNLRRIYLFLYLSSAVFLSPPAVATDSQAQQIQALIAKNHLKKTEISIRFCDAATGKTLFQCQPHLPLKPASNMKLITTAAALDTLGVDFQFETIFALAGEDLVIIASGDPLTGDPRVAQRNNTDIFHLFQQVLDALKQRNVVRITGNLLIDDTLFDDIRFHPSWPIRQSNEWYEAQVSALNFNDNCVDFTFSPTKIGQPAQFTMIPKTRYVHILANKCLTVAKPKNSIIGPWFERKRGTNDIIIRGGCYQKIIKPLSLPIDRPSAYFGFVLAEYLLNHNISIDGKLIIREIRHPDGSLPKMDILLTHKTPLLDVLRECNQRSLNLAAECLMKTMGAYRQPPPAGRLFHVGSWANGRLAVQAFLKKLAVPESDFSLDDGSGLSHNNRLSTSAISTVLTYIFNNKNYQAFRQTLANPENGTLSKHNRFHDKKYRGRIFAKTGWIEGAWALSGYCRTDTGKWLAFSILVNRSGGSAIGIIDKIVMIMMQ